MPLDELITTFEGMSATSVEKIASAAPTSGRTSGKHVLLKLLQPVDSNDLPENNLLERLSGSSTVLLRGLLLL